MPRPIPKPPRAEEVLATVAARPTAGQGGRPFRPGSLRHPDPGRAAADGAVAAPGDVAPRGELVQAVRHHRDLRGSDFDRIPATRLVRPRLGPWGERRDRSREALELESWLGPGHLSCGPVDRVPGRVEELQFEVGPPGDLSTQRLPVHDEQGVLRGLVAARDRCASGRCLDPLHARVVRVGEGANAVGQGLGCVVSLAGVQDLDGRVLKGDVGIRVVDVDDQRWCVEREGPEQVSRDERVGRRCQPRQGHRGSQPPAADPLLPFQGLVVGHLSDRHQGVVGRINSPLMGPVVTPPSE